MATAPMMLQRPPAPPPNVAAQTGAGPEQNPMAGVVSNIARQQAPQPSPAPGAGMAPGGAANPAGAFLAMQATMEKVLSQFGRMNQAFQPYADRALAVIQAGVAEVVKSIPGAQESATPGQGSPVTGSSPAGGSAAPAPGGAANGFPG